MKIKIADIYLCPYTREPLKLEITKKNGDEVIEGSLRSASGRNYLISDGIAYLVSDKDEPDSPEEKQQVKYYESVADRYEIGIEWMFGSFYADENSARSEMVDLLHLKPGDKVLETGSGTCRSSLHIAKRLDNTGTLFLQDLAHNMLVLGKHNLEKHLAGNAIPHIEFFAGNACTLPFPDGYFDSAFHFGALNLFADRKAAIHEMARVVRKGGRVVFGDESTAPWLKHTTYGRILSNSNALYDYPIPMEMLPENAEKPCLRWLIGNAFYLFDFTVGEVPKLNLDLPIPGPRGGTHRTRYYGRIEGVSPDIKKLAEQTAAQQGMNVQQWLERAIKNEAGAAPQRKPAASSS